MNEMKEFTIWIGSTVVRSVAVSALVALKAQMLVTRSTSYKKASVVEKQTGKTMVFRCLHMSEDGEFSCEWEEELP